MNTMTTPSAPTNGVGIAYLMKSDRVDSPITPDKWLDLSAWTNPEVKAVVIRTFWNRVEPVMSQYYWDFIDAGLAQAAAHGKKALLLVVAGEGTPEWFAVAKPNACYNMTLDNGSKAMVGLPWTLAFQGRWGTFIQALSTRFNGKVAHVDMGGFGRKAESVFASTSEDQAALDVIAKAADFASWLDAWLAGGKWVTDAYARYFTNSKFTCVTGAPCPTTAGNDKLKELIEYGAAHYSGRILASSHGLTEGQPPPDSIIWNLPAGCGCGFQFGLPQKDDITGFGQALTRATNAGAGWIEVYPPDCDDPRKTASLATANAQMIN